MAAPAQETESRPSQLNDTDENLYQQLHQYPFTSDPEFKLGLAVILRQPGTPASDEQINRTDDLVLKAKCFYFSRKQSIQPPLDFLRYRAWIQSHGETSSPPAGAQAATESQSAEAAAAVPAPAPSSTSIESKEQQPAYPSSFAHIVELITTGQPIPGIQHVPDTILAGKEGPSVATRRRKPWEKPEDSEQSQGEQLGEQSGTTELRGESQEES